MADDLYVMRYAFAEVLQVLGLYQLLGAAGFFFVLVAIFRRRGFL